MAQTVIGFFDDASEAQRAIQRLESAGISRQFIDVSSGSSGTSTVADDRSERGGRSSGIGDFFRSLFGGDNDDADRYSRVAERARSIVTVHAQNEAQAEQAADILDDSGAIDVDERASEYGYQRTGYTSDSDRDRTRDEDTTINRVEENLEVGKRTVERGGVRVRSRIVERPVEESVRLREEHVHVERNPVDRPLERGDMDNFRERDIELTERAEVPVVNKEARVVEEIRVSKDVDEREETIRDSVRSTDVDVENINTNDRDRTTRSNLDLDDDTDDYTDSTPRSRGL